MTCTTCGAAAVVQWRRRLPGKPGADGNTEPVGACASHSLNPAAASLVHAATCTGTNKGGACDCTPEPAPGDSFPGPAEPERRLPPGW
ncbi:hypothetical protein OOK31_25600 [Streptomyces sp. NBC_00249]|uniref:hypothetical protein n=1 Tax=Streptomyces sp. NBC_00249 TaxID=2975690 RepID=UPI002255D4EE|nr:hypothetical protein [Streptomyces sp. NBC_00249]MCX5197233.1 hypothetical protein [Streptomyces sp. NBC_00249]